MQTQNQQIREALEQGRKLTAAMMWAEFGAMRGAGRIFELRQKGLPVRTETISVRTRSGKARVARYSL